MENQKTPVMVLEKFGCFTEKLGKASQEFAAKFGDENGNVDINELSEILDAALFAYREFKNAYETCTGNTFNIGENNKFGKWITILIELLEDINNHKDAKG